MQNYEFHCSVIRLNELTKFDTKIKKVILCKKNVICWSSIDFLLVYEISDLLSTRLWKGYNESKATDQYTGECL